MIKVTNVDYMKKVDKFNTKKRFSLILRMNKITEKKSTKRKYYKKNINKRIQMKSLL